MRGAGKDRPVRAEKEGWWAAKLAEVSQKVLATWHYDGPDTSKGAEIIDAFSVLVTNKPRG